MTVVEFTQDGATLSLSLRELVAIGNALNAVCHDVHVRPTEIPTLIGASREELQALLHQVAQAVDDMTPAAAPAAARP